MTALRISAATRVGAVLATALLLAGCATTVAGNPVGINTTVGPTDTTTSASTPPTSTPTTSTGTGTPPPSPIGPTGSPNMTTGSTGTGTTGHQPADGGPVGLKPGVPPAQLTVKDATTSKYDEFATDAIADLYDYYGQIFEKDFGQKFVPPAHLQSYKSTDKNATVCGHSEYQDANAGYYFPPCNTVAWDSAVFLPQLSKEIGMLAPAVVLSHEMGHRVQIQLGLSPKTPTIVMEQQADSYAGAYWKWVADGHSTYFSFNQTEGMRQLLLTLYQGHDPTGSTGAGDHDHGNAFDRTFAMAEGYAGGAVRCSKIDEKEVAARGQEFPFTSVPTDFGNVAITDDFITAIAGTVNDYFGQTAPGYKAPKLTKYTGSKPPDCAGYSAAPPVTYCPTTNTISYDLAELQRIGTPTAGWQSVNGDFSALILLVSRYALAAQASGHSPIVGNNAGLRALCYTGTWATWMRNPQGPDGIALSPNDMDKAIYQIVASPIAASDANGATTVAIIDQVQAFDIGVTQPIPKCFDYYSD